MRFARLTRPGRLRRLLLAALAAAVAGSGGPADADTVIRLRDGTVHRLPFDPGEIESIMFDPPGAAAKPAADAQRMQPADRAAAKMRQGTSPTAKPNTPAPSEAKPQSQAPAAPPRAQQAAVPAAPRAAQPVQRTAPETLRVGPDAPYKTVAAAAAAARDGDTVEIAAGTYEGDAAVAIWRANNLLIRGVGGRPHMIGRGAHVEGKGIWITKGANTVIENIEISESAVPDRNGSGIRIEGPNIIIRNCSFHHNQDGILSGANAESDIVVERSVFAHNGAGDGYTHNMYIGKVRSFTLRFSETHHARVGHNVKTRAALNRIYYNRIVDEEDGTASFSIQIANGGTAFIVGNIVQQGPLTENWTAISLGAEANHPDDRFYVVNNTVVNTLGKGIFVQNRSPGPAFLLNNIFAGRGTPLSGTGSMRNNLIAHAVTRAAGAAPPRAVAGAGALEGNLTADAAGFVDAARHDFRLTSGSPAIGKGVAAESADGVPVVVDQQYAKNASGEPRPQSRLDLGALAFKGS